MARQRGCGIVTGARPTDQVKIYRRHNCERSHRTYRTLARCMFPRAAWIAGEEGPIALLAWCDVLTVTLHQDYDAALEAKRIIDYSACGGRCTGRHEIVRLSPAESETAS
jgi:protein involved in temperature-dependent protein secretion